MAQTITSLEIKIEENSKAAAEGLKALRDALKEIRSAIGSDCAGLRDLADATRDLRTNIGGLAADMNAMSRATRRTQSDMMETESEINGLTTTTNDFRNELTKTSTELMVVGDRASDMGSRGSGELLNLLSAILSVRQAMAYLNRQFEKQKKPFEDLGKSLSKIMRAIGRVAFYRVIRSGIKAIEDGFSKGLSNAYNFSKLVNGDLAKGLDHIASTTLKMKNQIGSALAELIVALQPFLEKMAQGITKFANQISEMLAGFNGSSTYLKALDVSTTWEEGTEAVKKYKSQLLGLDELNNISANNDSTNVSSMFEETEVSSKFTALSTIKDAILNNLDEIKMKASTYSLALGLILALSGLNIPLGIGLIGVGCVGLAESFSENWGGLGEDIQTTMGVIETIIGGALLGLGGLLAFSGANIPLGIGLMAVGATSLGIGLITLNWDSINAPMKRKLARLTAIVGGSLLGLGMILAMTGVNIPLGIGMIAVGALSLGTSAALYWDTLSKEMKDKISGIAAIVGGALLVIGALLCFTGVGIPLGIGLMLGGAATLGTAAALNWDAIKTKITEVFNGIKEWVNKYGSLVLGIILCMSGVGLIPGLALIGANVSSIASGNGTVSFDTLLDKIKGAWGDIKLWWSQNAKQVFTKKYWENKFTSIVDGLKNIDIKQAFINAWDGIKKWFNDNVAKIFTKEYWQEKFDVISDFISRLFGVANGTTINENGSSGHSGKFASGGYPTQGQLFFARENGPELVGTIGGQTAVANNDQITSAIASAVYNAIVSANLGSNVTIEGDMSKFLRVIKKANYEETLRVGV